MTLSTTTTWFLYYSFHFLYLGNLSDVLGRLWLAHDIAYTDNALGNALGEDVRELKAWKMFDKSMRAAYKVTSITAGLISGTIAGLLAVGSYVEHTPVRVLLLASLTCSLISAGSCISLLSTVYINPAAVKHHWEAFGVRYVIALSGPSAWLNVALWTFQAALLAVVWLVEGTVARGLVTGLIGFRVLLQIDARFNFSRTHKGKPTEFLLGLTGNGRGLDYTMVELNDATIKQRAQYVRRLNRFLNEDYQGSGSRGDTGSSDVQTARNFDSFDV